MRSVLSAAVLAAVTAACHPHAGGGPAAPASPYLAVYPGLRWVPADATYVATARHLSDAIAVVRELTLIGGVLGDYDLGVAERDSQEVLGVDVLAPSSWSAAGIDPDGGVAIFSQGLSPTLVVALADPRRTAAMIEERRRGNVAVEVSREGGVEVYTYAADRDVHLHWAIADRWLFVHVEVMDEHEPELGWFRALRAADGAFAAGPDLAAGEGRARLPGGGDHAPVVAVVKLPELRTRIARLGAPRACLDAAGAAGRAFLAAGVDGHEATGAIAIEIAGSGPADARVPGPAGWDAARGDAPIQAEWNADLERIAPLVAACDPEAGRELTQGGLRAARVFVHALDLKDLSGRGALFLAGRDNRLIKDALDQVPGLSLASSRRKVGVADVVDVSVPMIPSFSYALTPTSATAAVGDHLIDAVLGDGRAVPPATLGHLELHPQALGPDVWDALLEAAGGGGKEYRARTVRRLRHWDLAQLDVVADTGAVRVTVHGRSH